MKQKTAKSKSSKEEKNKVKKTVVKKTAKTTKKTQESTSKEQVKEKKTIDQSVSTDELSTLDKQEIIIRFALKNGDTGSPEVQVALATQKIANLVKHLEQNPKDNHSRRGLLKIVAKRRRVLNYLQKKDEKRYTGLVKKLELKK